MSNETIELDVDDFVDEFWVCINVGVVILF